MESVITRAVCAAATSVRGSAVVSTIALVTVSADTHAAEELPDVEIGVTSTASIGLVIGTAFGVAVVVSTSAVVGAARTAILASEDAVTASVVVEETSEFKLIAASCVVDVLVTVWELAEVVSEFVEMSFIPVAPSEPPEKGPMVSVAPAPMVKVS